MITNPPSASQVRDALAGLEKPELEALAERSGVSFYTLRKIQSGETSNPGIDTVARFLPFVVRPTGTQDA